MIKLLRNILSNKPAKEERCETCRFFYSYGYHGDCKRHAPTRTLDRESGQFPMVLWNSWCGDYERKAAEE